jgi:hypothetical protein
MALYTKPQVLFFFELRYYFFYLVQTYRALLPLMRRIITTRLPVVFLFAQAAKSTFLNTYLMAQSNKKFEKCNYSNIVSIITYKNTAITDISKSVTKLLYIKNDITLNAKLFNLFSLFNYSLYNNQFKINFNFKLLCLQDRSSSVVILNANCFLDR